MTLPPHRLPRRRLLLGLGGSALLAACSSPPVQEEPSDQGSRLWPVPPDQPRFAYETSLRTFADLDVPTEETRMRRFLSDTRAVDAKVMEKPSSIAARDGRIYVADSVRRSVIVFDIPRRRIFQFGLRAPGTLAKPTAIALDRRGRAYVADATLRKVFVYDTLGLHQLTLGSKDELHRPTGVAVNADGSRIYVIDRGDNENDQHRVMVYGADGKVLRDIGRRGGRPGEFNVPVQATVGPGGELHVLDAGNFRVQTFDPEGRFVRSFGKVGSGFGQFARPRALACDDAGRLYVSDAAFGNVQVFAPEGELLMAIGQGGKRDLPGRYGLVIGVAVDETGRLYVVDQLHGKIEVLRRLSDAEGRALQAAFERPT